MNGLLRIAASAMAIGVVWTLAAERAVVTSRLPVTAVVPGAVITQPFGCTSLALEPFDPYCPTRHFHSGVDLAAPEGTAVYSATDGRAITGYDPTGAGLFVEVTVDAHVRVLYCHLHEASFEGATVTPGEQIGQVGSSGLATGPHVHFEVQVDGRAVDPVQWLLTGSVGAGSSGA